MIRAMLINCLGFGSFGVLVDGIINDIDGFSGVKWSGDDLSFHFGEFFGYDGAVYVKKILDGFGDCAIEASWFFVYFLLNVIGIDGFYNLLKEDAFQKVVFVEGSELVVVVEMGLGNLVGGTLG